MQKNPQQRPSIVAANRPATAATCPDFNDSEAIKSISSGDKF